MYDRKGADVDDLTGKFFIISGMTIEVISDDDETLETRNITTRETVSFNKAVLQKAIKLGKAEEVSAIDANNNI